MRLARPPLTLPQKLWKTLWRSRFQFSQFSSLQQFQQIALFRGVVQQLSANANYLMSGNYEPKRLIQPIVRLTLLSICLSGCVTRERTSQTSTQNKTLERSSAALPARADATGAPVNSWNTSMRQININTASAAELEALPGIGKALAQRIIEHRQAYGPFRRVEDLIIVRGFSEKRFQALKDLITVD
jgi:competence ComEA-like helix-hairpin-helix protein